MSRSALKLGIFPLLTETQVAGHPLVYLDTGATSQVPLAVADAERDFTLRHRAAVHRGAHTLAVEATDLFEDARSTVSRFVGADPYSLWCGPPTPPRPQLAELRDVQHDRGFRQAEHSERFRVGPVTRSSPQAEHHASSPVAELAARTGATLRVVPVDERGLISPEAVANVLSDRTRLVAFTHVSNVTGAITDVPAIGQLRRRGRRAHGAGRVSSPCPHAH